MKRTPIILAGAVIAAALAYYLVVIPRYKELKRPLSVTDMAGCWVMTAGSMQAMARGGDVIEPRAQYWITFETNGLFSCRTYLNEMFLCLGGYWSLQRRPSERFKNQIELRFRGLRPVNMRVVSDSFGTVLLESWGSPDTEIDLLYRKEQPVEPGGAADRSQPVQPSTNPTSAAAGSRR